MRKSLVDFIYKIVLVGDTNVGKSCLVEKFIFKKHTKDFEPTIGVEFGTKIMEIPEIPHKIKIQIWDTSGNPTFRNIVTTYFEAAIGAIAVYDISNPLSFDNLREWVRKLQEKNVKQIVVVGCKADHGVKSKVSQLDVQNFCKEINADHFFISSREMNEIDEPFISLVKKIYSAYVSFPNIYQNHKGIRNPNYRNDYVKMEDYEKKRCCQIL